jgi:flagellar hook-associated protein 2
VKAVKSYVDALNGVIRTLADATGYDADAKKGGPLQGDPTARQLLGNLRSAATAPLGVDLGAIGSAFDVGIEVDRKGLVTLDETKLKAALADDFDGVADLFSRTATATDPLVSAATGTSKTTPGTHQVTVSRAADVARVTGAAYTPPGATEPKTFRITSGGKTATITIDSTSTTAEQAALAMQQALEDAGITGLTASATAGDELQLETSRYGSAATFTVEGLNADGTVNAADTVFGLAGTHAGVDVQGSFDGGLTTVTGVGQLLTADAGAAEGLSVRWTGTGPSAAPFEVTYSHGLAGGMSDTLKAAEGSGGSVARARKGIADRIDVYQTRIDGFEQRLLTRESTLRRQFTAMETALSQLNSQGSWLSSQLAGLNAYSQQQ